MSYILDALRKSDQLRRRNAAPTLLPGLAAADEPKQPPLLAYGALALVLLGAGIAIGWLRPWQSPPAKPLALAEPGKPPEPLQQPLVQTGVAPQPAAQAPAAEAAAQAVPAPAPAVQDTSKPARAAATESQGAPRPPAAAKESHRAPPAQAARESVRPAPAIAAPASAAAPDKAARSSASAPVPKVTIVMNMADLPLAIQQELPALSISVHAYSSNAAERLVGINGHLLHEGDTVAPGLTLEQITPAGMILSYKGYIFRHGVR